MQKSKLYNHTALYNNMAIDRLYPVLYSKLTALNQSKNIANLNCLISFSLKM